MLGGVQVGVAEIRQMGEQIGKVVDASGKQGNLPRPDKVVRRIFSTTEAERLVGRDRSTLSKAAKEGLIPAPRVHEFPKLSILDAQGNLVEQPPLKKKGYTIDELQVIRAHFKTFPGRRPDIDEAVVLAIQNFKGGAGKTSVGANIAHGLATRGHNVLIVDMDPQATLTFLHGFMPEWNINDDQTLRDIMAGTKPPSSIFECVMSTYWPNVDIIPANLSLVYGEMELIKAVSEADTREARAMAFRRVFEALQLVKNNYDVVIIDSQPGLGALGISTFCAADAVIVPSRLSQLDLASTGQFFNVWADYLDFVWPDKKYSIFKIIPTQVVLGSEHQGTIRDIMANIFRRSLSLTNMFYKKEIERTQNMLRTPYEDHESGSNVMGMLDSMVDEVEEEIWALWPSKAKLLREHKEKRGKV